MSTQITERLRRLTNEQKKIFLAAGIVILAFLILVRFIYIPQKNRFESLKKELKLNEAEIGRLKKMLGVTSDEAIAKSLDALQAKLKTLNTRFSLKEETILRELPNFSDRFDIKIKSMQPQKKKIVSAIDGAAVTISGCDVSELQIAVIASGTYKNVGSFLRLLKEEFPSPVKINNIRMSKDAREEGDNLNIALDITAYTVSPRK